MISPDGKVHFSRGTLRREAIIHLCQCWDSAKPHHSPPRALLRCTRRAPLQRYREREKIGGNSNFLSAALEHFALALAWIMCERERVESAARTERAPLWDNASVRASEWVMYCNYKSEFYKGKIASNVYTLKQQTAEHARGGVIKMLRCLIDVQKVSTSPCASFFTSQNFRPRDWHRIAQCVMDFDEAHLCKKLQFDHDCLLYATSIMEALNLQRIQNLNSAAKINSYFLNQVWQVDELRGIKSLYKTTVTCSDYWKL